MNVNEYQDFVVSRMKSGQTITDEMTPHTADLVHVALGIADEFLEINLAMLTLNHENVIKECGDLLFYVAYLDHMYDLGAFDPYDLDEGTEFNEDEVVQSIIGMIKKAAMYNKELDIFALGDRLQQLVWLTAMVLVAIDSSIEDAMAVNVHKLTDRFPDGYSDKAAIDRKDMY